MRNNTALKLSGHNLDIQKSRYPEIRTSQMTRLEWLLVTSAEIIISIIVIVIISIGFNDVTLTVIER